MTNYWIDKITEAFNLVPMQSYVRNIADDPFKKILANYFSLDDVYLAKDLMNDACEAQTATYRNSDSEFGRIVIDKCEKAKNIISDFYDMVIAETNE